MIDKICLTNTTLWSLLQKAMAKYPNFYIWKDGLGYACETVVGEYRDRSLGRTSEDALINFCDMHGIDEVTQ